MTLFSGPATPAGMPEVYRAYLLLASEWQLAGSGIVTIYPLNGDSPTPQQNPMVVTSGGALAAVRAGRDAVLSLETNVGLRPIPADLEAFQSW